MSDTFDLLIVGGGINGASIARAAALAGRRVLLVERGDLAQGTSSISTKLMHGGLRYLERFEFKLVAEALRERSIMLRTAPHIVRPLEFRLPHDPTVRPWLVVRLGLWLYDLLAWQGALPRSRTHTVSDPMLKGQGTRGFSYWDGWVDDARLVVLNAMDAAAAGAVVRTRTALVSARRTAREWFATLQTETDQRVVAAKGLVNAAGPWVEEVLHGALGMAGRSRVRLVRGSHIVTARRLRDDHAWLLQQPDGRVVFAIPYLGDFTLVGTTDVTATGLEDTAICPGEIDYLLAAANRYMREPLARADIVAHFSGIRPLFDDGAASASAISRDYRLELDRNGAPLLSVFGGKITTARHLAEVAIRRLGIVGAETRSRVLPGGDIADTGLFLKSVRERWPFLDEGRSARMAGAYGTRIADVLGSAVSLEDLGVDFGAGLCAREVDYLVEREWACSAEDILWRRSKLGMRFSPEQTAALRTYLNGQRP